MSFFVFSRMIDCLREENAGKLDVLGWIIPLIFTQDTPLPILTVIIGKNIAQEEQLDLIGS